MSGGKMFDCVKIPDGHMCQVAAYQPGETECPEAVLSVGRACRKCKVACYRRGWSKESVDFDNAKLVRNKIKEAEHGG